MESKRDGISRSSNWAERNKNRGSESESGVGLASSKDG